MTQRKPLSELYKDVLDLLDARLKRERRDGTSAVPALTAAERVRLLALRTELVRALADLALFAEKLPDDQAAQVFTRDRLEPLVRAVLKVRKERDKDWEVESRTYNITAMLIELAVDKCVRYLQDADVDYLQLAARDLNQTRLWTKVAGSLNIQRKRKESRAT